MNEPNRYVVKVRRFTAAGRFDCDVKQHVLAYSAADAKLQTELHNKNRIAVGESCVVLSIEVYQKETHGDWAQAL